MDYFTKQLDEEIARLTVLMNAVPPTNANKLLNYVQAKIEYGLVFQLAVLWNENIECIRRDKDDLRVKLLTMLRKITIGDLLNVLNILNKENDKNHGFRYRITGKNYLGPRNDFLGHGWTFTDDDAYKQLYDNPGFIDICNDLYDSSDILKVPYDIIQPENFLSDRILGAKYSSTRIDNWQYTIDPRIPVEFKTHGVYGWNKDNNPGAPRYINLSPFIGLTNNENRPLRLCLVFQCVDDSVSGKAKYNTIFSSEKTYKTYDDFQFGNRPEGVAISSGSNYIKYNIYATSYTNYIVDDYHETYIRNIEEFIQQKNAVTLTLQGQGGIGKTALVQYVIDKIINGKSNALSKYFNYIIFCTAKTTLYGLNRKVQKHNYQGYTASYEDVLIRIYSMLVEDGSNDIKVMEETLVKSDSKFILVIDDFESFSDDDRTKIADFVKQLDVNKHKVIITTRVANFLGIGQEIQMSNLSDKETISFLVKNLESRSNKETIQQQLHYSICQVTMRNSLFIIQLAELIIQFGIDYAMKLKEGEHEKDITFLYGKIYDSLTPLAQQIFVVMGGMLNNGNLSNLIEKLQYVVGAEGKDEFHDSLNKLVRMLIVKKHSDKYEVFEVYNEQIWKIMNEYWIKLKPEYKTKYENKINKIATDRPDLNLNNALLQNLKLREQSQAIEDTVGEYRAFLSRPDDICTIEEKLGAIINLLDYLKSKAERQMLINMCRELQNQYKSHYVFVKKYAEIFWEIGVAPSKVKLTLTPAKCISESVMIIDSYLHTNSSTITIEALELRGILVERRCLDFQRQANIPKKDRINQSKALYFAEQQRLEFYKIRDEGQQLLRLCQDMDEKTIQTTQYLRQSRRHDGHLAVH